MLARLADQHSVRIGTDGCARYRVGSLHSLLGRIRWFAMNRLRFSSEAPHSKKPTSVATGVLLTILSEMTCQGVSFALMGRKEPVALDPSSDIDLVFEKDPRQIIDPILRRMQSLRQILVVHRLHYDIPYCFYYVIKCADDPGELLLLDCLYDPWGVGRYHLTSTNLLEDKRAESWGYRASEQREAIYLLIKRSIKGTVTADKFCALKQVIKDSPPEVWREIEKWFGESGRGLVDQILTSKGDPESIAVLPSLHRALERRFRSRHPLRYLAGLGLTTLRRSRRFLKPTGLFVVVLGPDGSGKSTVSSLVLGNLERAFRRTRKFHWRPGLLRKLGRIAKPVAMEPAIPSQASKYRGFVSLARFIYYWLDFVIGYWVVIYPAMARTGLVIGERYFLDVLVTPARYGFAVPRPLMRATARLVPSPDLVILLKGEPEAIHLRKPELTADEITALMQLYEDEIQRWGRHVTISTEEGAAAVAAKISDLILEERAAKTARQIGWTA